MVWGRKKDLTDLSGKGARRFNFAIWLCSFKIQKNWNPETVNAASSDIDNVPAVDIGGDFVGVVGGIAVGVVDGAGLTESEFLL